MKCFEVIVIINAAPLDGGIHNPLVQKSIAQVFMASISQPDKWSLHRDHLECRYSCESENETEAILHGHKVGDLLVRDLAKTGLFRVAKNKNNVVDYGALAISHVQAFDTPRKQKKIPSSLKTDSTEITDQSADASVEALTNLQLSDQWNSLALTIDALRQSRIKYIDVELANSVNELRRQLLLGRPGDESSSLAKIIPKISVKSYIEIGSAIRLLYQLASLIETEHSKPLIRLLAEKKSSLD